MEKHCGVCSKQFGLMTRGKECSVCLKFICKEHLVKLMDRTEICMKCEIDKVKDKRKAEISLEFEGIEAEIRQFQDELEGLESEKQEKMRGIEGIERDLVGLDREKNEKIMELEKVLDRAKGQSNEAEKEYLEVSGLLEKLGKDVRDIRGEIQGIEGRNRHIEQEVMAARDKKQQYGLEIEYLNSKVSRSIPVSELEIVLCAKCKAYAGNEYFPRVSETI